MKKYFSLIFLSILVGCATTANYDKILKTSVGKSEKDLVAAWGIPQGSYENEGIRYLTYSKTESGVIPGQPGRVNTVMIGGKPYSNLVGATPAIGYSSSCTVIFKVVNKLVVSYEFKGDGCKAYE